MIVTNKINTYLHQNREYCMDAVQGDTARVLELSLYAGSEAWIIPEGATAQLRFRKPDGTGGAYDTLPDGTAAGTCRDNVVTMALAPQVLTASGTVEAQLLLCWDGEELASFTIAIHVQADPSRGTVKSEDYVNLSKWVTTQVRTYLDAEQESLREIFATPGAFLVEAKATEQGCALNKTYAQIRSAAYGTVDSGNGAQVAVCVLHRSEGEDVLLRLVGDDTERQKVTFAALDGGDWITISISADEAVEYSLTPMASLADTMPVIVTFDWDGVLANRELSELYPAYQAGKRIYFRWGDLLLPTVVAGESQWRFSTVVDGTEKWVTLGLNDDGYTAVTDYDSRPLLSSLRTLTINGTAYDGSEAVNVDIPQPPGEAIVDVSLKESDDTKNVLALTNFDDGVRLLELPRGMPVLYVEVDIRNSEYTADKTAQELYAAHEAGRVIQCKLLTSTGDYILPVVGSYKGGSACGLFFGGARSGVEWYVTVGTSEIRASRKSLTYTENLPTTLPNPQPLTINGTAYDGSEAVEVEFSEGKQWHLIEKRTITGMLVSTAEFSGLNLSAMRAYLRVPKTTSSDASAGAELYVGSTLVGYGWLSSLVSSSADRVAMVEAKIDGGLVDFGYTLPADAGENSRAYYKNPNFKAVTDPITKFVVYAASGTILPTGMVIELWGKDA